MEGAQWVGQPTVTGAHFSPCVWSGLWLLGVWFVVGLGLLSAVPNPDTTTTLTLHVEISVQLFGLLCTSGYVTCQWYKS